MIENARRELAKCDGCTGAPCQKGENDDRYYQPVVIDGEWTWGRCKYYVEPIKPEKPEKPEPKLEEKPPEMELVGEIFKSASIAEALKLVQAKQEALKPEYCAKYGLTELDTRQLGQLQEAERRLSECEGCNGHFCNKATAKYQQPRITLDSGTVEIETVLCEVWREEAYKEQCKRAGVPCKYIGKTFEDYELTGDNKQAVSQARWFLRAPRDKGLYIFGGVGTGKTFLASLIAQENVIRGKGIVFGDVPELLDRLKKTFGKTWEGEEPTLSGEQILKLYYQTSLLILDDFGAGQITEWAVGVLYQIINERYNAGKPVIVTSNYDLEGLEQRLIIRDKRGNVIDAFSANRIVSRLKEMCYQAFVGTSDRRG